MLILDNQLISIQEAVKITGFIGKECLQVLDARFPLDNIGSEIPVMTDGTAIGQIVVIERPVNIRNLVSVIHNPHTDAHVLHIVDTFKRIDVIILDDRGFYQLVT